MFIRISVVLKICFLLLLFEVDMNKNKIEKLLKNINEVINEDVPTNAEYIVLLANMLRIFAIAGIEKDNRIGAIDINDSFQIESACFAYPDNVSLQLMLQSHVLLKLSETYR